MKQLLFVCLLFLVSLTASAQRYAHVNFGNLLALMPEVKTSETTLKSFETVETEKGQAMVKAFQDKLKDLEARVSDLTPNQLEAEKQKLNKDRLAIQQFEQELSVNIERKRQELLGPIIQKAKDAIEAEGKAGGYALVFDSSIFGNILFAEEATDLLPAVKKRLGIE